MREPFEHRIRVRYSETDQMGVVYHANYLVYMDEGRTLFLASLGLPYDEVERGGHGLVVRKANLRYRHAARYGDELLVRTWVDGLRAASVTFRYELLRLQDHRLLAQATVELACVDLRRDERPPTPLPEAMRRALAD